MRPLPIGFCCQCPFDLCRPRWQSFKREEIQLLLSAALKNFEVFFLEVIQYRAMLIGDDSADLYQVCFEAKGPVLLSGLLPLNSWQRTKLEGVREDHQA